MKIKLIIILFIILKINLFSKEPKQFEGLIEYKVRSEILLNKLSDFSGFMFDSLENDVSSTTIKNALDSLKNDVDNDIIKLPKKVLFYSNKNGDYRIEYYNIQLIEYFIYKSNVNKFYTSFQDSILFEAAGDENRFNLYKNIKPEVNVLDTTFTFQNKKCKKITIKNQLNDEIESVIEYTFSETDFKVNPDYYVHNNFNSFYDYVKIAQSLPIIIHTKVPNFLITEQTLVSYKEYDVNDSLFYIDTSKIKNFDNIFDDFKLADDRNKDLLSDENQENTDLTEEEFKIIENGIFKLNLELTKDYEEWKLTKAHLDKCRLLLDNWHKDRVEKKEGRELSEEDEELLIKLLERLSEILENMNED